MNHSIFLSQNHLRLRTLLSTSVLVFIAVASAPKITPRNTLTVNAFIINKFTLQIDSIRDETMQIEFYADIVIRKSADIFLRLLAPKRL
jgi:hypothetical protein